MPRAEDPEAWRGSRARTLRVVCSFSKSSRRRFGACSVPRTSRIPCSARVYRHRFLGPLVLIGWSSRQSGRAITIHRGESRRGHRGRGVRRAPVSREAANVHPTPTTDQESVDVPVEVGWEAPMSWMFVSAVAVPLRTRRSRRVPLVATCCACRYRRSRGRRRSRARRSPGEGRRAATTGVVAVEVPANVHQRPATAPDGSE
jgi:hypothetical protein